MDTPRMRIIVVEDETAHAQAISRSFDAAGSNAVILVAASLAEYRLMVAAESPDIVLMDLLLPDGRAIDELIAPSETGPFPILIMTSHGNEQVAVEAIKRGALDYVVKSADAFADMPRIVARALREWNLLKERQRMADALRKSEKLFRTLVECSPIAIYLADEKGDCVHVNQRWCEMAGLSVKEASGKGWINGIHPEDRQTVNEKWYRSVMSKGCWGFEYRFQNRAGEARWVIGSAAPVFDEKGAVTAYVGANVDITDLKLAEEALKKSEGSFRELSLQFHSFLDAILDNIIILNPELEVVWANKAAADQANKKTSEVIGVHCYIVWHNRSTPCYPCPVLRSFHAGESTLQTITTPDKRTWELRTIPMQETGSIRKVISIRRDITDQKKMEEQLRQAGKMEAVGRLAGGIAHDFNNMLSVILGYTDMILEVLDSESPFYSSLIQIKQAGQRSADLTRQLLAFSRRQIVAPRVVNLNELVANQQKMLARMIGENITIVFLPDPNLWNILIDPSQIDQILANLAVNARDAITDIGTISISTANFCLDQEISDGDGCIRSGEYIRLSFSDTGCGMDKETLSMIFEPFFTTKEVGKGTGLGLATIYGIVKQNNGFIQTNSEPGQGATFNIYFPRAVMKVNKVITEARAGLPTGSETVLLVEDDEQLLLLVRRILERQGYKVLTAMATDEALRLATEHAGNIHLLLTDVIMPLMNGKELHKLIEKLNPKIKAIFMSGYTGNIITSKGELRKGVDFIQKPFTMRDLAEKVRMVIDAPSGIKLPDGQKIV